MRLVLVVMRSSDVEPLLTDLTAFGFAATQIQGDTTGRFGVAAVIAGVDDDQVADVVAVIHAKARGRIRWGEPMRPIGERSEFWIPGPVEQDVGSASVFVLPVRRYVRIGYA